MPVLTRKVLLLNASYEPDGVIDMVRAVLLVWKGSAQAVEIDATRLLHSQHRTFEVPSVIRLVRYVDVRRRRRESGKQRFRIFVRDGFRCQYCTKRFAAQALTLDHILPRSRGGADDQENLATSCIACNQRKGNRTPDEARMPLYATPSALRYGLDRAMLRHYAESRPEWRPYLFLEEQAA
jgi:5-methylcytosine-specific restriction endonuclease McrA